MLRLQLATRLLCCQGDAGADCNPVTHLRGPLCSRVEMWPTEQIHIVIMNWQWTPWREYVCQHARTLSSIFLNDLAVLDRWEKSCKVKMLIISSVSLGFEHGFEELEDPHWTGCLRVCVYRFVHLGCKVRSISSTVSIISCSHTHAANCQCSSVHITANALLNGQLWLVIWPN